MTKASSAVALVTLIAALLAGWPAAQAQQPAPKKAATAPAAPAAQAPEPAANKGPDMTSETYGDWVLRCQQVAVVKNCEVSQTLVLQGQQRPIALVAFGREKKGDPIRIVVQLPTNITFEGGVKALTADGNVAADMVFRRCFPSGCFADVPLDDATLAKFKSQTEPANIKFKDGTEREISLPLSLKGLGSAIDALNRS